MKPKLILLLISFLVISSCGQKSHYRIIKFPSGKEIKFMGIYKVVIPNESPALMFKYETDIPIDNVAELKKEAEAIWQYFKIEVEKAGHTWAAINANAPRTGFIISTNKSYGFIIERIDGKWEFKENTKNNT